MGSVSKTKIAVLSLVGTILPVALAFTAFFISRSTIGSAGDLPASVPRVAPVTASPSTQGPLSGKTPGEVTGTPGSPAPTVMATATDDHGGRCSEPEHTADPTCSDSSGKGGGGGDDSNPDNSGKGSSGSGGGDD
jgi:hypothetical protein